MRKLIAACILLWALHLSAGTTTLTGTIRDEQGNPLNGTLVMRLPIPAMDPTTQVAIAPTPVSFRLINGQIVGGAPLYDLATIQPQNLWYAARGYDTAGRLAYYGNFYVTGASFNLGDATPTTVTTSNISFAPPVNTYPAVNVANIAGVDWCARVNAAILANPNQTIDARGLTGNQNCASNPFTGVTTDVYLLVGFAAIQTTVPWSTPSGNRVLIYGSGRGDSSGLIHGTTIRAVTGFPTVGCAGLVNGCPIIRLGTGTTNFGTRLENLTLDCNGIFQCIGAYSTDIQEQSGLYHFSILNSSYIGLLIDGTGNAGSGPFFAENYEIFDGEIYSLSFGQSTTICAEFLSQNSTNNGPRQLQHVTCSGTTANHIGTGFLLDGITGHIEDLNSQFATTAYQFGGINPIHDLVVHNIQCQGGFTAAKCAWIKNPGGGVAGLSITGILNGGVSYPVTLQDDTNGSIQYTDFFIGTYIVENGNQYRISTASAPLPANSVLPGMTLNSNADIEQQFILNGGKTVQKGATVLFQDRGTTKWVLEYPTNAQSIFHIFDQANAIDRYRANSTTGQTFLNSTGGAAVFFNNDASSGTGGISVCNGGATCNFTVNAVGNATVNRLIATAGTHYAGADSAIVPSAGWGTTPTVSAGGVDQGFRFGITPGGTGIGANPTIAITFKDGAWPTIPTYVCGRTDLSSPWNGPPFTWTENATSLTITFNGTPVSASTYQFFCVTAGASP